MDDKVDWYFLIEDTRARVYLLWAVIVTVGFITTHFFQVKQVNAFWTFLSVIGMYYMYRVMPLKVRQMWLIFVVWLVAIIVGMLISGLVFIIDSSFSSYIISHLGGFWLLLMAAAYAANGYVDKPAKWYTVAAGLNLLFGILCLTLEIFQPGQYLVAAAVSAWSMLLLWLYRTSS